MLEGVRKASTSERSNVHAEQRTEHESVQGMTPERARPGTRVRAMGHHRIDERRDLIGTVVAVYGGEEYVAVDVRLTDGERRLFRPRDLEEISPPKAWWRLLLGRDGGV